MAMGGHDPGLSAAANYRRFAAETADRSPQYEALALAVAQDGLVLGFLAALPQEKRQPNLLFAAARYLLGTPADPGALRALIRRDGDGLAQLMLTRRTQTNEPARCATLLPALAALPPPLALIEVGASAGLTLLFDRYSYDYGTSQLTGSDPQAPVLHCEVRGAVPVPAAIPAISWRAGLDLQPLDVHDPDTERWLRCLVWPGEGTRDQTLAAAIAAACREPPALHRGDLRTDLAALAAQAPAAATLVIFHSAVLAYVTPPDREDFAATVRGLGAVWLSNEAPGVVSGLGAPGEAGPDFLLGRDGRVPLARTDGHGAWIHWMDPATAR